MTAPHTPADIDCLKGNMLLALASMKTRFIGFSGVPVQTGELHFLSSRFKNPDGSEILRRVPIVIDRVDPDKCQWALTKKELQEAGYSDLDDLRKRVTMDQKYAEGVISRHGNGAQFEHPLDESALQNYPAPNFTFHLATSDEVARHPESVEAASKVPETIEALIAEKDHNSMPGALAYAMRDYHLTFNDLLGAADTYAQSLKVTTYRPRGWGAMIDNRTGKTDGPDVPGAPFR